MIPADLAVPPDVPDWFVCRGGDSNEGCCDDPDICFGSVAAAIRAASSGDLIHIGPGVYDGPLDVAGKALTIRGNQDLLPILLVQERTARSQNVVTVHDGGHLTLRSVIVASGETRALEVEAGGTLIVQDSVVLGALFTLGGAARAHPGAVLQMQNAVIHGGTAGQFGGQIDVEDAELVLESCLLSRGVAVVGGGAVSVRGGGTLRLEDTVIDEAMSDGDGGAIWADGPGTTVEIHRSRLSRNVARRQGGAVALSAGAHAAVANSLVVDNEANGGGGGVRVGGYASLDLVRARFERNRSYASSGGAVWWAGGSGESEAEPTIWTNNWFIENTASSEGGALLLAGRGAVRIVHSGFLGNGAGTRGGAIAAVGLERLDIEDTVIAWTESGGGLAIADEPEPVEVACSGVWYANAGGDVVPSTTPGCLEGGGNLVGVDPSFYAYSNDGNSGNDDLGYHPLVSPLADAGTTPGPDRDRSPPDVGPAGGPEAAARDWADEDGDGWPNVLDCNDADPAVHPGIPSYQEDPNDGLDSNCDGSDHVDLDRDGSPHPVDCDDTDPTVHPGAGEDADLSVDRDCDGFNAPIHGVRPAGCGTSSSASPLGLAAALFGLGRRRGRR